MNGLHCYQELQRQLLAGEMVPLSSHEDETE